MIAIHQNSTFIHVRVIEDASLPSLYTKPSSTESKYFINMYL